MTQEKKSIASIIEDFRKWILVGISVLLIIIVLICMGIISSSEEIESYPLDNDWKISYNCVVKAENGSFSSFSMDHVEKKDKLIFKRTIKREDINGAYLTNMALLVSIPNITVEAWVDKKKIYSCEEEKENFLIQFPEKTIGKEIKLEFTITKDEKLSSLKVPMLIEERDYVKSVMRENYIDVFLAGFFMIFGGIAIILSICTRHKNLFMQRILLTGLYMLCICLWLLSKNGAFTIFVDRVIYKDIMNYYSVYFGVVFFEILAYTFVENKLAKRVFKIITIVSTIMAFGGMGLNIYDRLTMHITKTVIEGFAIVSTMWSIYAIIKEYKEKTKSEKYILASLLELSFIMVLEAITYNVSYYVGEYVNTSILMETGLAVYIVLMIFAYAKYSIELVYNHIEKYELSNKAYKDMLTGLYNRGKVIEEIDILKEKDALDYTLINFDLNNLKQINDTNGHIAGDMYLSMFAQLVKDAFNGEIETIGRVGGDEFIAITDEYIKRESVEKTIKKIQKELENKARKKIGIEASFAYGFVCSCKRDPLDISIAYKQADEMMYACKKRQKQNMGQK